MRLMVCGVVPVALSMASASSAQTVEVRSLVERFETARLQHDPAALTKTLAPDYEEISPIGEVDSREQVLGFYAPELKRSAPPMTSDDVVVRARGAVAVLTTRKSVALPNGSSRSVRVRYVARRDGGRWLLISAQYTPIHSARAN